MLLVLFYSTIQTSHINALTTELQSGEATTTQYRILEALLLITHNTLLTEMVGIQMPNMFFFCIHDSVNHESQ